MQKVNARENMGWVVIDRWLTKNGQSGDGLTMTPSLCCNSLLPHVLEADAATPQLDDPPGNKNPACFIHSQPEPAMPAHGIALRDCQRPRKRGVGRDQPAAQIRAGRAGARILDDHTVLGEEESSHHRIRTVVSPDIRHRPLAAPGEGNAAITGE